MVIILSFIIAGTPKSNQAFPFFFLQLCAPLNWIKRYPGIIIIFFFSTVFDELQAAGRLLARLRAASPAARWSCRRPGPEPVLEVEDAAPVLLFLEMDTTIFYFFWAEPLFIFFLRYKDACFLLFLFFRALALPFSRYT